MVDERLASHSQSPARARARSDPVILLPRKEVASDSRLGLTLGERGCELEVD